jgi:hydrogenase maturation protein HypF
LIAFGGHLKNAVAAAVGDRVHLGPHVGDLDSPLAVEACRRSVELFAGRAGGAAVRVADLHPDYRSTQLAEGDGHEAVRVQHHCAHVLACLADNELEPPVLGIAWDGSGLGADGTLWGGEFLVVEASGWRRAGHLRTFPLPGGERAIRHGGRAALGLLYELHGERAFEMTELDPVRRLSAVELRNLGRMLATGLQSPHTSSAGRLFDVVAALIGLRQASSFEGQAAMALEFAARSAPIDRSYPFDVTVSRQGAVVVDWAPIFDAILHDLAGGVDACTIAARFHESLAMVAVAVTARLDGRRVLLTGGCFQNVLLLERTVRHLEQAGCAVFWHRRIPPNDGGIAVGQVLGAARMLDGDRYVLGNPG